MECKLHSKVSINLFLNKLIKNKIKDNMSLNFSFQNIPKDIFKCISFFLKMNDVVSLGLSSKKQSKLIKTSIHKYISEKRWYYKSLTKLPVKLYKHVTLFDCRHRHEVKSNLINLKCLFLRFNTLIPTLMFQPTLTHLTIGGVVPQRPIEPVSTYYRF